MAASSSSFVPWPDSVVRSIITSSSHKTIDNCIICAMKWKILISRIRSVCRQQRVNQSLEEADDAGQWQYLSYIASYSRAEKNILRRSYSISIPFRNCFCFCFESYGSSLKRKNNSSTISFISFAFSVDNCEIYLKMMLFHAHENYDWLEIYNIFFPIVFWLEII